MNPPGQRHVPDMARVERELTELWRQASTDEQPVMRACELNLVVACADGPEDCLEATRVIAGISETTPCRAIVISPRSGNDDPGLEVYASAHCHRIPSGARVCSEQITIESRGACGDLAPGAVRQLLVEDIGVWTWWRRPRLKDDDLFAGLLGLSDRFLVDSATIDSPRRVLRELHEASGPGLTVDVNWARLDPWREALASFFDVRSLRPHLDELTAVEVSSCGPTDGDGATASAAYLTGWLASRLAWKPTRHPRRWQRPDGGGVTLEFRQDEGLPAGEIGEVRLTTERADTTTAFVARRLEACSNVVLLSMDPICSTLPTRRIQLPERDATAWMCGTLQDIEPDPVFAAALRDAIRIL